MNEHISDLLSLLTHPNQMNRIQGLLLVRSINVGAALLEHFSVDDRGLMSGDPPWTDEIAELFFSHSKNQSIEKLCVQGAFVHFNWLRHLPDLKELEICCSSPSGDLSTAVLDLSVLPHNWDRDCISITITTGSLGSLRGLFSLKMDALSVSHVEFGELLVPKEASLRVERLEWFRNNQVLDLSWLSGKSELGSLHIEDVTVVNVDGLRNYQIEFFETQGQMIDQLVSVLSEEELPAVVSLSLLGETWLADVSDSVKKLAPAELILWDEEPSSFGSYIELAKLLPDVGCTVIFPNADEPGWELPDDCAHEILFEY